MTTEIRSTPETDQAWAKWPYAGPGVHANFARKLERERDEAKALNRTLLDQLEAKDAQIEAMRHCSRSSRMSSVCREKNAQLEAMREAIKDAHYALGYVYNGGAGSCAFPFRTDDDLCSENRFHHVKDALDALKPLLP